MWGDQIAGSKIVFIHSDESFLAQREKIFI